MFGNSEVSRLLLEASVAPNDEARIPIIEQAVRQADSLGDIEAAWDARCYLIEAAMFSGQGEKALVAFTWCLTQCDNSTTSHTELDLFWQYKWIVGRLTAFPQISKARILEAWDDLARRYDAHGMGARVKWKLRAEMLAEMGELAESEEPFEQWLRARRDTLSDCRLCDEHGVSRHRLKLGNYREAMDGFLRIVRGNESCRRVPQATYGIVLRPLLELGRPEVANSLHHIGLEELEISADCLNTAAHHIRYKVFAQDVDGAKKLAERFWRYAETSRELNNVFAFYIALRALLRDVGKRLGEPRISLRPPRTVAQEVSNNDDPNQASQAAPPSYELTDIATWVDAKLSDLATRFDTRNGNNHFTRRIARDIELDNLSFKSG